MKTQKSSNTSSNRDTRTSSIARLVAMGKKQSFITAQDILQVIPHPEQNIEQVDRVFAALLCVGIPYVEDPTDLEGSDKPTIPPEKAK